VQNRSLSANTTFPFGGADTGSYSDIVRDMVVPSGG
jgi:hypothetical protein